MESAWTISDTTVLTSRSSSPSAITRITGSVPEGRMTSRPDLPSLILPSLIALSTPTLSSGWPFLYRTFWRIWGDGSNRVQTSLTGFSLCATTSRICKAVTRPSPVVEKSDRTI